MLGLSLIGTAYAQAMSYGEPLGTSPISGHYWKYVPLALLGMIVYFVFVHKKK